MEKITVQVDGIEYIEVRAIGFVKYAEISSTLRVVNEKDRLKMIQRKRLMEQCQAFDIDNNKIEFTESMLTQLPPRIGKRLIDLANITLGTADGEPDILSNDEADGITAPILVKLSQPLKTSKEEITELEFMAKTFGDIESACAEINPLQQTLTLISTVARPVMSSMKLQMLPSWAVDQISVIDGSFIAEHVTPRFLE